MGVVIEVKYFNSFWMKKVCKEAGAVNIAPSWPGIPSNPPGYPAFPFGTKVGADEPPSVAGEFATIGNSVGEQQPWFIEEMWIKGGFNNTPVDLGVKAYIVDERRRQEHLFSSLIYSGIFNSRTGVNQTNVFSVGEQITKSVDPINGSIQKLYAEDTNLILFQENKVSRALIDKDVIYTTEGGTQTQPPGQVIGQIVPFLGEYGISTNPESFAIYGYRKYFADRNRGCILRLSRDGITEISEYGMNDYFRDALASLSYDWVETHADAIISNTLQLSNILVDDAWEGWFEIQGIDCCEIKIGAMIYTAVADSDNNTWSTNYIPAVGITLKGRGNIYVEDVVSIPNGCRIKASGRIPYWMQGPVTSIYPGEGTPVRFITNVRSQLLGGWDIHNKNYVLSIQPVSKIFSTALPYYTVTFDERINGWSSFHSYKPAFAGSLKNKYYSFYNAAIYEHYDEFNSLGEDNKNRGIYYGLPRADSSITFIFNPNPSVTKNFKTISYEGSSGWEVDEFKSGFEGKNPFVGVSGTVWLEEQDQSNVIYSYEEGLYTDLSGYPKRAGFDRKENRYVANLVGDSATRPGEVIITGVTGIKGYFATVKVSTDETTDPGGMKELYSVGSNYVLSSY